MRVVVPIVAAVENMSGVQRHAINLVRSLLQRPEVTRVHLVAGKWQSYLIDACPQDPRVHLEFLPVANTLLRRNAWYYASLPDICRMRDADIVHLSYPVPLWRSRFQARVAVTLHDLYPFDLPENFGFPKVLCNQVILRQCLRSADAIACVSESTLGRLDGIEPLLSFRKAVVIQNAVERSTAQASPPAALGGSDRFLLCIAQHRRNKNILLLLNAYSRLLQTERIPRGTKLVVIGVAGPETAAIQDFIRIHALEQDVLLLAGLSEGELQWCYQRCIALVAPSITEGFGLPIAEGLLAGCPIVCSDIPAFREIGGDHCRYLSLTHEGTATLAEALADAIAAIASQPRPPAVPLPQLSFETIGEKYLNLYDTMQRFPDSFAKLVGKRGRQLQKRDIHV